MDLKRIRYFVAVADARSFSRAAERLNIAQPPLSQRIHELEVEIGARLIDRAARPLRLTEVGQAFLEQARQILVRVDQLETSMRTMATAERPRLKLGAPPSAFPRGLPQTIRRYRELMPDGDFSLVELTSQEQADALKAGLIDVGIGRVRIDDPMIQREMLIEEPLVVALPWDHPLAGTTGTVPLASLVESRLALYPRDAKPSFGDHILSTLHDRGLAPTQIVEVADLQTALVLVAAGEAVSLVPDAVGLFSHSLVVFRSLTEPVSSPLILSARRETPSSALTAFLIAVGETLGATVAPPDSA